MQTRTLNDLLKTKRMTYPHPLEQWANLIRDNAGIIEANSQGFTVRLPEGSQQVEFDGGLTQEHYHYFCPLLDDEEKIMLAQAVLQNLIRPSSFLDWDRTLRLLPKNDNADTGTD